MIMERTAILRSLSCSSLASNRFLFRSFHRLSRSSLQPSSSSSAPRYLRRPIPALTRRSTLRHSSRLLPSASPSSSLSFNRKFSSLSTRAIATQPSPGTYTDACKCAVSLPGRYTSS